MRRHFVAPAIVLAWFFAASSADARIPQKAVTKSVAAVKTYWTAARMEAAKPADRVAGQSGKQKRAPAWSSHEVTTPYTEAPTSTHGKVFFTLGGVDYVCSGTALLSPNKSVVWTAGHCTNEGPGAFATNWEFVPAYRDGTAPLGVYVARDLYTTSAWANSGDSSYDLGAAVVGSSGGSALTDVTGGRGVAFNYPRNQAYHSYGYPAAPPFTGERLWVCDSSYAGDDSSLNPPSMAIGCDMTGGSSGGGWIVGSSVYSVNSYGYTNQPDVMYGPYQGDVAQSLYTAASAG